MARQSWPNRSGSASSSTISPSPPPASASFGVAAASFGMTAVALIKAVDDALYRAKTMGRNRVVSTTQ